MRFKKISVAPLAWRRVQFGFLIETILCLLFSACSSKTGEGPDAVNLSAEQFQKTKDLVGHWRQDNQVRYGL